MRRSIKYPVTVAFVLLLGYSQLFTYVYLGVLSPPAARIADGIEYFQLPLTNTNLFNHAIIEEIEESKTDRDELNVHTPVASLFLSSQGDESFLHPAFQLIPDRQHSLPDDSYIRFRVFRL